MAYNKKSVILCILDGWGAREESEHNAIKMASSPNWDEILEKFPNSLLKTSGLAVGLPEGQMGNSEVGHMNIGGGRIVMQNLPKIDAAINDGALENNQEVIKLIDKLKGAGKTCHIMGLASDGGVHAHQDHIIALAKIISKNDIEVKLHLFTDGRDTAPASAAEYISKIQNAIDKDNNISIATISGRYYAMDRDKRWDRVELAYNAIIEANAADKFDSALDAIKSSYAKSVNDEFIDPVVIGDYAGMSDGDAFIMANFRSDRARQILHAIADPKFDGFVRKKAIDFSCKLGMVEYSSELNNHVESIFKTEEVVNSVGEVVANNGICQLRISETEKYAHVTFFFNGGVESEFSKEDRILIPSPDVTTYDLQPEMSSAKLTEKLVAAINSKKYGLIVVNFANTDMVGHTGNEQAAIKAVEAVDGCLKNIVQAALESDSAMLITADHGNAEQMVDENTGEPHTAHTSGPVPFVLVGNDISGVELKDGKLCDISPTILDIMQLEQPPQMTGESLLK
ncbi:2,3-bisphosphoglycerate-independent phosphoglycerate mutase [Rickettsiales bacterium]|nr:2,3-bisphosphoglycerate-independent phosphoglycerate mutase [Rickettsiales bacterium]